MGVGGMRGWREGGVSCQRIRLEKVWWTSICRGLNELIRSQGDYQIFHKVFFSSSFFSLPSLCFFLCFFFFPILIIFLPFLSLSDCFPLFLSLPFFLFFRFQIFFFFHFFFIITFSFFSSPFWFVFLFLYFSWFLSFFFVLFLSFPFWFFYNVSYPSFSSKSFVDEVVFELGNIGV